MKRIASVVIAIVLMFAAYVPLQAQAETGQNSISITVTDTETKAAVSGVRLSVYKIAELTDGDFNALSQYSDLNLTISDFDGEQNTQDTIKKIEAFIKEKGIAPKDEQVSDNSGYMNFTGLEDGLYLIRQNNVKKDFDGRGYFYTMETFLVDLPHQDADGTYKRNVVCEPKGEKVPDENVFYRGKEITVNKLWKDENDKYGKRPDKIVVGLYQGDKLVEKVVLNDENNWTYEWDDLDENKEWTVKEITELSSYKCEIKQVNGVYSIKNTYTKKEKTPKKSDTDNPGPEDKGYKGTPVNQTRTGDNMNLTLWIALLVVAAGAVTVVVVRKRKKE